MTPGFAIALTTKFAEEITRENGGGEDKGDPKNVPEDKRAEKLSKSQMDLIMKDRAKYGR